MTAAVLALSLFTAAPSLAATVSGQQLLSLCTANMGGSGNALEAAECMGFVVGVADTFDCVEDNHGYRWNSAAAASQPALVAIVVEHIRTHPTALISGGHVVVAQALSSAFPCPRKTAGN